MIRRLSYTSDAKANLDEIGLHVALETRDIDVSDALLARIDRQCQKLAELPGTLGTARPELRHDLRSIPY